MSMIIPEYLRRDNMTAEDKRELESFIEEKRRIMRKAPAYPTEDQATDGAVKMLKADKQSLPSVWREPRDVGRDYAVVELSKREAAQVSGYTERVTQKKIFEIAKGDVDEIEEV